MGKIGSFFLEILKICVFVTIITHGFNAPHSERYMYSKNGVGYLEGTIDPDMARMKIGDDVKMIVLNSPGGNVFASLNLAMQIVQRQIPVGVGPDAQCSSACMILFQSSPKRFAAESSYFGFHSPFIDDPSLSDEEYEYEVQKVRVVMAEVLIAGGMELEFIESWIYSDEVEIYTAEELYDMGYIDDIVSIKRKRNKSLHT